MSIPNLFPLPCPNIDTYPMFCGYFKPKKVENINLDILLCKRSNKIKENKMDKG
jgi:hypothetical protein